MQGDKSKFKSYEKGCEKVIEALTQLSKAKETSQELIDIDNTVDEFKTNLFRTMNQTICKNLFARLNFNDKVEKSEIELKSKAINFPDNHFWRRPSQDLSKNKWCICVM